MCANDASSSRKLRDLWNWELDETYAVHEALGALGRKFALLDRLAPMTREQLLWFLLPIGEPLAAPKQKLVQEVADRFEWADVAGYKVPLVKLQPTEDRLVSEVCTVLYKRFPAAPFTACLMSDGISYGLRSDKNGNNTDVGAIAKSQGGGGHRNASGFQTPSNT